MLIIGLDAAVQEKNIGAVAGYYISHKFEPVDVWTRKEPLISWVLDIFKNQDKILFAIDAPLGWPEAFKNSVSSHKAGRPFDADAKGFFKRHTDLDIIKRFRKHPLEVSADRIARTAFFTLRLIGEIEEELNQKIEVVWDKGDITSWSMIEVYPAATLLANNLPAKGYKKENVSARKELLVKLQNIYPLNDFIRLDLTKDEHSFDAFLCCLAGIDFLNNRCKKPDKPAFLIKSEGWIWVKKNNV